MSDLTTKTIRYYITVFCMFISLLQEILDVKTSVISSEYSKEISDSEDSKVISDGVRSSVLMVSEIKLGYIDT